MPGNGVGPFGVISFGMQTPYSFIATINTQKYSFQVVIFPFFNAKEQKRRKDAKRGNRIGRISKKQDG
jgi:hypothetical protein